MIKNFDDIAIQVPETYLPKKGTDLGKWAVVACDQFTSEPEYWGQVKAFVGAAPSTLNLILPEVFLEEPGEEQRIHEIHEQMHAYLQNRLLEPHSGIIYVERQVGARVRRGLVLALDLEKYDFNRGSTSLIRATEGTIIERLPPRMKVRRSAELELPHILVLINDPQRSVIEPVTDARHRLEKLYDFELMFGSGHLGGYAVDPRLEAGVIAALRALADPGAFAAKYSLNQGQPVLLFAMGDGNHSLATAKAVWDELKTRVGMDHPARYALVEVENVHDDGLQFEPIHRVLFGLKEAMLPRLESYYGSWLTYRAVASSQEMIKTVDEAQGTGQLIGLVGGGQGFGVLEITRPSSNLPVGTLQEFLDPFVSEGRAQKIDYIHGAQTVCSLGARPGNAGFYVPCMRKDDLFKTVILDGTLPRKTFSLGEAREKRFYMETRKIT
jgi:hypothetical protein